MVTFIPVADTTLIEQTPTNNLGGQSFFNTGTTEHLTRNRGLIRFDLSTIPRGSAITSASVRLNVVHEPNNGFEPSEMDLHRLLRPWGEGNKAAIMSPGLGVPATTNEATWNSPFTLTGVSWRSPGGEAGTDYAMTISGAAFIYGTVDSPYLFASTNLTQDVQAWVDTPTSNYGWILVTAAEDSPFTARRFGSREAAGSEPVLQVEFIPGLRLIGSAVTNGIFSFQFKAISGIAYIAEYLPGLGLPNLQWQFLTNFTASSSFTATIVDAASETQRFYRIRVQ